MLPLTIFEYTYTYVYSQCRPPLTSIFTRSAAAAHREARGRAEAHRRLTGVGMQGHGEAQAFVPLDEKRSEPGAHRGEIFVSLFFFPVITQNPNISIEKLRMEHLNSQSLSNTK